MVGVEIKGILVCDQNGLPLASKDVSISPGPIALLSQLASSLSGQRTTVCLENSEAFQIYPMNSLTSLPLTSILSDNLTNYCSGSISIPLIELNLKQTLLGGQSFRWFEQNQNEFIGVLGSFIIYLQRGNENLFYTFYTNVLNKTLLKITNENDRQTEASLILQNYFQLSVKLYDLFEKWCQSDERFQNQIIPSGIRVLAQDPLENLISFICSSNNNVQRITKMVNSLCQEYGKEIGTLNGITYHEFPTIDELDKPNLEKRLRELNFGYRARYIQETVKYLKFTINDALFFDQLKSSSVTEARKQLLKIMGVGRKVADCVLLMSLGKQDVVPVDTHIHAIAVTHYGQRKKIQLNASNYDGISSFFEQLWQPYAGWAQAAAFSNELRLTNNSKSSIQSTSLKRSISSHETHNQCQLVNYKKKGLDQLNKK
ncbi:unnamed protein product [Rotaria socialis]|uniref:DNA-(apurinic or apyrimidinic site) lyase n=2 Tax=Rotaria socialis TaxID=392032 RepID=A0A820E5Q0_9BILA|nr:unnamed protein product [Rotaria socialis]CAF4262183.1 unnamed protein product [Rotaria socialis]CAF4489143.1 unnamed protein product [Rotaria socialis]CAF4505058.1 unnamed protein product [Rotaria socialis]